MAVVFDIGSGGFMSVPNDIDPTTKFGQSKLGREIGVTGGRTGGVGLDSTSNYEGMSPQFRKQYEESQRLKAEEARQAELDRQVKANRQAEIESQRQAGIQRQQTQLAGAYRTRQGTISAQEFRARQQSPAQERLSNVLAYQKYKGTESKYLSDVEKKAYEKYKEGGMSEAQARYSASKWRKGQEAQIKASGSFTITKEVSANEVPATKEQPVISSAKVPERIYTFRDVDLFPKYKQELWKTGRISLQSYLIYKGDVLYKKAEDKVYNLIPGNLAFSRTGFNFLNQGINIKEVFDYRIEASPTGLVLDTLKLGFFYPAMLTTPQALSTAIKTGGITPVTETQFKSLVINKGEFYNVKTMSVSRTGGLKVSSVSQQIVKDYSDDVSLGIGKGISGSKVGHTSKIDYNVYDIVGINKNLGGGRLVSNIEGVTYAKNIGTGVKGASISEDFLKIIQRRGLGGVSAYKNIPPNLKAQFNYGNVKVTRQFDTTNVVGVLNKLNVEEEVYGFIGTTNKPITRITASGISYKIYPSEINVRGIIKYGTPNKVVYFGEETRQGALSNVFQTPVLSNQLKTGVASQSLNAVTKNINALNLAATKDISRTISGFTSKPIVQSVSAQIKINADVKLNLPKLTGLATQEKSGSRFADMTGKNIYADYAGNKFNDLGTLSSRFNSDMNTLTKSNEKFSIKAISKPEQKYNQRFKGGQKSVYNTEQITKQKQLLNLNLKQPQRQSEKLKTSLRLQQKLTAKQKQNPMLPGIKLKIPKFPKEPTLIPLGLKPFKLPKQTFGKFPVMVRRFGKWKNIGFGTTKEQALFLGKRYSTSTLARSFYIPNIKQPSNVLGFRTKKEKVGQIYIQRTGKGVVSTLGSAGEKAEIKFYRGLKLKPMKMNGGRR